MILLFFTILHSRMVVLLTYIRLSKSLNRPPRYILEIDLLNCVDFSLNFIHVCALSVHRSEDNSEELVLAMMWCLRIELGSSSLAGKN